MKFNHLNVPTQWRNYWTRYPEGHTILEALIQWVSQVDSMVDNQNKLNDNVEQFRNEIDDFVGRFDERLQTEVTQTLEDWQNSGFLDVVISSALQWQLDDYIATNEQDKLSLTAQLQQTTNNVGNIYSINNYARKTTDIDDTERFNRAIEDISGLGGGTLLLDHVEYIVESGSILLKPNVSIKGMGNNATILRNKGNDLFVGDGTGNYYTFAALSGFQIYGDGTGKAFNFYGVSYTEVTDVWVFNQMRAYYFDGHSYYNTISGGRITGCAQAIEIFDLANANTFNSIKLINNVKGVLLNTGENNAPNTNVFNNVSFEVLPSYTGEAGIAASIGGTSNELIGCRFEIHKGDGLILRGNRNKVIGGLVATYGGGLTFEDRGTYNDILSVSNMSTSGLITMLPNKLNSHLAQGQGSNLRLGQQRPNVETRETGMLWFDNSFRAMSYFNGTKNIKILPRAYTSVQEGLTYRNISLESFGNESDRFYGVLVTTSWNAGGVWVPESNKTISGFEIRFENPAPSNATLVWEIIRE